MKAKAEIHPTGRWARSLPVLAAVVLATTAVVGALPQAPANARSNAAPMAVGIPAYFYPGGTNLAYWSQLRSGYPAVTTAIATGLALNGTAPDGNYQSQISQTNAKGIHVLAYVDTDSGARPADVVKQEIDKAYAWYAVDGIFFDRAVTWPVTCTQVSYYQALSQYVKTKGGDGITALNHGQILPECYAAAADILVIAETTYEGYTAWQPWGWEQNYPAAKFWHMVYSTPTMTQMQEVLRVARARNAGTVFVSSVDESNPTGPWGALPSDPYWSAELSAATSGSAVSGTAGSPGNTTTTRPPTTTTTVPSGSGPSITSFSPTSGPPGTTVTISGSGFSGLNSVTLNGAPVAVVSYTNSTIVVRLSSWSTSGVFSVRAGSWYTTTATSPFIVG